MAGAHLDGLVQKQRIKNDSMLLSRLLIGADVSFDAYTDIGAPQTRLRL